MVPKWCQKKSSAANINYCGYVTVPYISLTIKMPFLCAETPPGLWMHGIFFISLPILQQHLSPVPMMFLYWSHPKNSGFKAPGSCQARSNRHQEENPPSTCRLALGQISAVRLFNTCVRQYRNSLEMCSAAQEYKKKTKKNLKKIGGRGGIAIPAPLAQAGKWKEQGRSGRRRGESSCAWSISDSSHSQLEWGSAGSITPSSSAESSSWSERCPNWASNVIRGMRGIQPLR